MAFSEFGLKWKWRSVFAFSGFYSLSVCVCVCCDAPGQIMVCSNRRPGQPAGLDQAVLLWDGELSRRMTYTEATESSTTSVTCLASPQPDVAPGWWCVASVGHRALAKPGRLVGLAANPLCGSWVLHSGCWRGASACCYAFHKKSQQHCSCVACLWPLKTKPLVTALLPPAIIS